MKRLLAISGVLSWINLVIWGFIVLFALLLALVYSSPGLIGGIFIMGSVVFHSYAAIKLRQSVKNPNLSLGNQTPVGIRLMGALTLFIGIMLISEGIAFLQNTDEVLKYFNEVVEATYPGNAKKVNARALVLESGILSIVLGLGCASNAIVNFRMLRWYLFIKNNELDKE